MTDDNSIFTPARLATLADGVFAIAMTLLVLDLRLPEELVHTNGELFSVLLELLPSFESYVVSFIILSIFWVGHHNFFHFIERVDRPFLWINIVLLMLVSLVPFFASLLGKYADFQ